VSLAKAAAKRITPAAQKQVRVLVVDIERLPGVATVQHRGLTITGDFWDLGSWKHTIGRRIHADDVIEWPRTICAAAKWYNERQPMFAAEWLDGGHEEFIRTVWEWFNEADITVGHNVDRFDQRILRSDWSLYGWTPPRPWKTVDTLKVARTELGYESNTLDSLCKRLGVKAKTDKYSVEVARAACEGDERAQRRLQKYNEGDIRASQDLYDRLRPWIRNHPHLSMWSDNPWGCPNCGEKNLSTHGTGEAYTNVQRYRSYVCPRCGHHVRGNRKLQDPTMTRTYR